MFYIDDLLSATRAALRMFEELLEKIKTNTFTEEFLSIPYYGLKRQEAIDLAEALSKNSYIRKLDLSGNQIDDIGAKALASIQQLTEIDLTANNVGPDGAKYLAESNVTRINLSANPIGDLGAANFSSAATVTHLYLNECNITENGIAALLQNPHLKLLSLFSNNISPDSVLNFSENHLLEELNLSQNRLVDKNILQITKLTHLKYLNLRSNSLTDESALAISNLPNLETLVLSQNRQISGNAVKYILQSDSIKSLTLFNNGLSFSESDDLPKNNSIVEIDLSYNNLDDRCKIVLEQLATIPTLRHLDLANNRLGTIGIGILTQCRTDMLKTIDLKLNPGVGKSPFPNPNTKKRHFTEVSDQNSKRLSS